MPRLRKSRPMASLSSLSSGTRSSASTMHSLHSIARTPTTMSSAASSEYDSCSFDVDDFFAKFREDLDITDDYPSRQTVQEASGLPVYDENGNSRTFGSLYAGDEVVNQRQLFVFVRYFYCGGCQAYLRALTEAITPEVYFTMPIPTSIIVIGCGRPELIADYKKKTNCPFPIYADPSRKIYKKFGMSFSLKLGKRPEYCGNVNIVQQVIDQLAQQQAAGLKKAFKGGPLFQIGGEFLFEDGEIIWCHRMKNVRDHSEIKVIKNVLELDWEEPVVETATIVSARSVGSPNRYSLHMTQFREQFPRTDSLPRKPELVHERGREMIQIHLDQDSEEAGSQFMRPNRIDSLQVQKQKSLPGWPLYPVFEHSPRSSQATQGQPRFLEAFRIPTSPSLISVSNRSHFSMDSLDESYLEDDSDSTTPTDIATPKFLSPVTHDSASETGVHLPWLDEKERPYSAEFRPIRPYSEADAM